MFRTYLPDNTIWWFLCLCVCRNTLFILYRNFLFSSVETQLREENDNTPKQFDDFCFQFLPSRQISTPSLSSTSSSSSRVERFFNELFRSLTDKVFGSCVYTFETNYTVSVVFTFFWRRPEKKTFRFISDVKHFRVETFRRQNQNIALASMTHQNCLVDNSTDIKFYNLPIQLPKSSENPPLKFNNCTEHRKKVYHVEDWSGRDKMCSYLECLQLNWIVSEIP